MKVRAGFVSNSSSSSFAIFGACLENDEVRELLAVTDEEKELDVSDLVYQKLKDSELDYVTDYDSYYVYIGLDYAAMKDDETKAQFKNRVAVGIRNVLGKDVECGYHVGEVAC